MTLEELKKVVGDVEIPYEYTPVKEEIMRNIWKKKKNTGGVIGTDDGKVFGIYCYDPE